MKKENVLQRFLQLEAAGGILLFIAAAFALVLSNSPFQETYQAIFNTPLHINLFYLSIDRPFLFCLMSIAIFDDVCAIFIIAIFHTQNLSWGLLLIACLIVLILYFCKCFQVKSTLPYLLLGVLLWLSVLNSGVHATLAGVILGLM